MRVPLPKAEPVSAKLRQQFDQVAGEARAIIDLVSNSTPARFE